MMMVIFVKARPDLHAYTLPTLQARRLCRLILENVLSMWGMVFPGDGNEVLTVCTFLPELSDKQAMKSTMNVIPRFVRTDASSLSAGCLVDSRGGVGCLPRHACMLGRAQGPACTSVYLRDNLVHSRGVRSWECQSGVLCERVRIVSSVQRDLHIIDVPHNSTVTPHTHAAQFATHGGAVLRSKASQVEEEKTPGCSMTQSLERTEPVRQWTEQVVNFSPLNSEESRRSQPETSHNYSTRTSAMDGS